jgi:alpha-N-acetylglucosamine transferase
MKFLVGLFISIVISNATNNTKSRGIILCGGNHMVKDAEAVHDQTRIIWKSDLPVTMAHCGELYDNSIHYLESINITVLDICQNKTGNTILGMTMEVASKRLKSWYCKTAALILSPYEETLISDLDVIWFKSPDVLFESPGYKQTGSMFFRDKLTHSVKKRNKDEKVYQDVLEDFIVREGGFNLTTDLGKDQFSANGVSFFWYVYVIHVIYDI